MLRLATKYLKYLFSSVNAHGVHSPFVYQLFTKVISDKQNYSDYEEIEALRKQLKNSAEVITITDYGAGGATNAQYPKSIAKVAKNAAKPPKYAQLLYRLCKFHQPEYMLELGTSLGISTAYQAMGAKNSIAKFTSLEGSKQIANRAVKNLEQLGISNLVNVGVGNFDETLPDYLAQFNRLDYVFFDGNHRYSPTIDYFEQCIDLAHEDTLFVFDDIRWSDEMEQAWEEIKQHPRVSITVDLFFVGLVYFKKGQAKQHFQLRF